MAQSKAKAVVPLLSALKGVNTPAGDGNSINNSPSRNLISGQKDSPVDSPGGRKLDFHSLETLNVDHSDILEDLHNRFDLAKEKMGKVIDANAIYGPPDHEYDHDDMLDAESGASEEEDEDGMDEECLKNVEHMKNTIEGFLEELIGDFYHVLKAATTKLQHKEIMNQKRLIRRQREKINETDARLRKQDFMMDFFRRQVSQRSNLLQQLRQQYLKEVVAIKEQLYQSSMLQDSLDPELQTFFDKRLLGEEDDPMKFAPDYMQRRVVIRLKEKYAGYIKEMEERHKTDNQGLKDRVKELDENETLYKEKIQRFNQDKEDAVASVRQELEEATDLHHRKLEALRAKFDRDLEEEKAQLEQTLKEERSKHKQAMFDREQELQREIRGAKREGERKVRDLTEEYEEKIRLLKEAEADRRAALEKKVDDLESDLRRREREFSRQLREATSKSNMKEVGTQSDGSSAKDLHRLKELEEEMKKHKNAAKTSQEDAAKMEKMQTRINYLEKEMEVNQAELRRLSKLLNAKDDEHRQDRSAWTEKERAFDALVKSLKDQIAKLELTVRQLERKHADLEQQYTRLKNSKGGGGEEGRAATRPRPPPPPEPEEERDWGNLDLFERLYDRGQKMIKKKVKLITVWHSKRSHEIEEVMLAKNPWLLDRGDTPESDASEAETIVCHMGLKSDVANLKVDSTPVLPLTRLQKAELFAKATQTPSKWSYGGGPSGRTSSSLSNPKSSSTTSPRPPSSPRFLKSNDTWQSPFLRRQMRSHTPSTSNSQDVAPIDDLNIDVRPPRPHTVQTMNPRKDVGEESESESANDLPVTTRAPSALLPRVVVSKRCQWH